MTVVVPAGLPLLESARWVGGSCWLELHAHQVLTTRLGRPEATLSPDARVVLWTVRAHRAEMAEQWHRRLPELAEMPRSDFVLPPPGFAPAATDLPADAAGPDAHDGPDARHEPDAQDGREVVLELLEALRRRYHEHQPMAAGPADGPVRSTLSRALVLVAEDLGTLGSTRSD